MHHQFDDSKIYLPGNRASQFENDNGGLSTTSQIENGHTILWTCLNLRQGGPRGFGRLDLRFRHHRPRPRPPATTGHRPRPPPPAATTGRHRPPAAVSGRRPTAQNVPNGSKIKIWFSAVLLLCHAARYASAHPDRGGLACILPLRADNGGNSARSQQGGLLRISLSGHLGRPLRAAKSKRVDSRLSKNGLRNRVGPLKSHGPKRRFRADFGRFRPPFTGRHRPPPATGRNRYFWLRI